MTLLPPTPVRGPRADSRSPARATCRPATSRRLRAFLDGLDGVDVAGDRVVHGGARFHATLLPAAATYAVGRDRNVRRYGFHGLSHAYAARRAAELSGDERRRIVTCLLWLLQRGDMHDTLEHRSGMRALAATADMEAVVARAEAHEPHALLAFEVYVHRLRAASGAMAASLSGLDALVFTAGVGENAPRPSAPPPAAR